MLIQPVDEHDLAEIENELNLIRRMRSETFRLIAVRVNAWNRELSPWEAPAVFGKEPFGGSGADMLKQVLSLCGDGSKTYIIGGYMLVIILLHLVKSNNLRGAHGERERRADFLRPEFASSAV